MSKISDNNTGRTAAVAPTPTGSLLLAGLLAAVTSVCSWINVPLFFTPVPVNLALIGPYLAGLLLGVKYGVLSQIIYIFMGAVGLPVFAGFTGGVAIIAGPTGGFLVGYILCAAMCGLRFPTERTLSRIILMIAGLACCYGCGLIWFMISTHSTLWGGLVACVLPFLPGDAVKIAVATVLAKRLLQAVR